MATFAYTAIEAKTGRERRGAIDADTAEQATNQLKGQGLAPTSLARASTTRAPFSPSPRTQKKTSSPPSSHRRTFRQITLGRPANAKAVTIFTRQLATLAKAGMPLLRALEVLARQEKSGAFRRVIETVAETVRTGGSFSDGLQRHPKIFDRLYLNMAKAGEAGGSLETVLERVALFREKADRIRGKVKAAMTYPFIVIALAIGIVSALMVFVVPRFEQIFSGMLKGQPLPALTQAVLGFSRFFQHNILLCLAALAACLAAFAVFRKTRPGRRALDGFAIHAPVLGELFLKVAIARFTRTFGTLLASGVPILPALAITRETSGNVHLADAITTVHDRVKEGESVATPLAATRVFPPTVASMIEVGEETGALPEMLGRIADVYDEEVDNAVASLTSLIEPLMIVFLALLVGTIVIALFLPIVSIIQHLQ
jgi:Type II secretory pathway, component PulF